MKYRTEKMAEIGQVFLSPVLMAAEPSQWSWRPNLLRGMCPKHNLAQWEQLEMSKRAHNKVGVPPEDKSNNVQK